MQQLIENLAFSKNHKLEFYMLYQYAIEVQCSGKNKKVDNITLKKNSKEVMNIINYYTNEFRSSYGPILMDKGYVNDQGQLMEYYQSSKPITFPGLEGCLGVKVGNKGGVHLVSIWCNDAAITYLKRIKWIYGLGGKNVNLKIAAKKGNDHVLDHIEGLKELLKDKNERIFNLITIKLNKDEKEKVEWFIKRLENAQVTRANDGIATL